MQANNNKNELYSKFRNEYLKEYLEEDFNKYPFPHTNVSDIKYAAQFQNREEENKLFKMFKLIKEDKSTNLSERKTLIRNFYKNLDRKYNDQTPRHDFNVPRPDKVGLSIDKILYTGIRQIGLWATGVNNTIYSWMVAGENTAPPTYGDRMIDVIEIDRVNVITDAGFLDAMNDGWSASGGFDRGTPTPESGFVSEIAMADTEDSQTSTLFDMSILPIEDRIPHEQNDGSFSLSVFYVITSI